MVKNWNTLICSTNLLSSTHYARQLNEVLSPDKSSLPLKFPATEAEDEPVILRVVGAKGRREQVKLYSFAGRFKAFIY